jgi:hypothetical protein
MTSLAKVCPTLVLGAALLAPSGCYRAQVSSTPTHDLGYDRRTQAEADDAEISSEWQAEPGRITGKVNWGSCRLERMTYQFDTVTTRREPNKVAGYALLGGGVLAAALGISLWGASASCPNGGCSGEKNSTFLILGLGAGLPAIGVGAVTLLGNTSVIDERGPRKEDAKDEIGPCLRPEELPELALVLKIAEGKELPVNLREDGSATIEIPAGLALPENAELPILVQRVPKHAGDVLRREQQIGTVTLGTPAP